MTQTMKTAKIRPRYFDVDALRSRPSASAIVSSTVLRAGVHMKTNVYMAPSDNDDDNVSNDDRNDTDSSVMMVPSKHD